MCDKHISPDHHAILIGINAYKSKPLRGAVRDVQEIAAFLKYSLALVHLRILTATSNADDDIQFWPTYPNVKRAFEEVTQSANEGDFVYIHYSGHGTREVPNTRSYNESGGDLALVLLTGDEDNSETYLFGRSLSYSINAMVRKGLIVTMVLDCCFSASVYRVGNPDVRFLAYDGALVSKSISDSEDLNRDATALRGRDISMGPNWLVDPEKYVILVACGPHEEAGEIQLDGKIHGILSHFLLVALREHKSLDANHKEIYNHLAAELRRRHLHQHPVLYGQKSQGFFGSPQSKTETDAATIMVIKKADNTLELQVGKAHGISENDQFALEPLGASPTTLQESLAVTKVSRAGALTSDLEPLIMPYAQDQTRWRATPLTQVSFKGFSIRLASNLPRQQEWLNALKDLSLNVHAAAEDCAFSVEVALNASQEYTIRDQSGNDLINLPTMSQMDTDVDRIYHILEHLARFRLARELSNHTTPNSFRDSFNMHILIDGKDYSPGAQIEMKHGSIAEIVLENREKSVLYLSIYDLGPCWQVDNVTRATYTVVTPKNEGFYWTGVFRMKLKMTVPRSMVEKGFCSCDDTLAAFVSSHPTSFDFLELPKLGEPNRPRPGRGSGQEVSSQVENWAVVRFPVHIEM